MTPFVVVPLLIAVVLFVLARFNFWSKEALKLQQKSGYVPPASPLLGRLTFRLLTGLIRFLFIGPLKVIGRRNAAYKGRLIIAPNHTFPLDFAVVSGAVGRHFRYMTAIEELAGIRGLIGAWTGAYAVDRKSGGAAAAQASVDILIGDGDTSRVLLFPQGKLIPDGLLRPEEFKTGAVRIAKQVSKDTGGQPVAILPVGIDYKRNPKDVTWLHTLLSRLGFKAFRKFNKVTTYSATVVIGEPIPVNSLPDDVGQATEILRARIQEVLDEARKN